MAGARCRHRRGRPPGRSSLRGEGIEREQQGRLSLSSRDRRDQEGVPGSRPRAVGGYCGPPCRVPRRGAGEDGTARWPWIQQSDLEESSVRPGCRPRDEDSVVLTQRRQVDVRDRGESHLRRRSVFSTNGRVGGCRAHPHTIHGRPLPGAETRTPAGNPLGGRRRRRMSTCSWNHEFNQRRFV